MAYPRELHDYHNDLPFMCGRRKINEVEKLVPNLHYKKRYVIHIKGFGTGFGSWIGTRENT